LVQQKGKKRRTDFFDELASYVCAFEYLTPIFCTRVDILYDQKCTKLQAYISTGFSFIPI